MTNRTVQLTDYDAYLKSEYPAASDASADARAAEEEERRVRLTSFPFDVVLQLAFAELDSANRWCWQQLGPAHGECYQSSSEYSACALPHPHSHTGSWTTHWLAKTDYDFGYNEWSFQRQEDRNRFLEFVPDLNWGEHYPK